MLESGEALEHGEREALAADPNSRFHRLMQLGEGEFADALAGKVSMKASKASLKLIRLYPWWYAASAGIWALAFFVTIVTGLAMRGLFNRLAAGPARLADVWTWIAIIAAVLLGRVPLEPPAVWIYAHHVGRIWALLRANLMRGYLRLLGTAPRGDQGGAAGAGLGNTGDALSRMRGDVELLALLPADEMVDASGRGLRLIVMLGIMLAVSPMVTLAVVPPLAACAVLASVLSQKLMRYRQASRAAAGDVSGHLNEMLGGVQALKGWRRRGRGGG